MTNRGPKPKPPEDVRNIQLPVRVTAKELKNYKEKAKKTGKDLSCWIRETLDEKT
jgi:hypothetical protein